MTESAADHDRPFRKPRSRRRGHDLAKPEAIPQRDHARSVEATFGADRPRIRALLRRDPTQARALIERSRSLVESRRARSVTVSYPDTLPFTGHVEQIKAAMNDHRVLIVAGETGSGKSTQLPKLCLDLGRGVEGMIAHTQPRRIAARSVGSRVAEELGVAFGHEVGCTVRFRDDTTNMTRIRLMTDGVLLTQTRRDRLLEAYDTIIIDEAHERSLNIDFLLGIVTRILHRRQDLKVIVTSATIETRAFADHFERELHERVPIVEVSGRTYPVETVSLTPEDAQSGPMDLSAAVAHAVSTILGWDASTDAGDVLVFLPGEREIREASHALRRLAETDPRAARLELMPLYARLSPTEQARVFQPGTRRRIVLATNVAETSLTVPGIRYVVDSGLARINRYSTRRRVQSLQVEPVSQASARQRAGRCGRVGPGTCVRLYTEDDHDKRPEFTQPEIQRTDLAGVILQMHALSLGEPSRFPFVEPPETRRINDGHATLHELGAIDAERRLTTIGKTMAKMPVDPRVARILIEAGSEGAVAEALIVASALETQDPRERPADRRDAADAAHARHADPASDFRTLVHLWDFVHQERARLSRSGFRAAMRDRFLSLPRLFEWFDTHRQLRDIAAEAGLRATKRSDDPAALQRALLSGFVTSVGQPHPDGGFATPYAGRFHVHPASAVKARHRGWLLAADLTRTTRLYARLCGSIDAAWVEAKARHLVQREYNDPRYNPEAGRVEASCKVSLGAITIANDRRVDFASVDRTEARSIFIREALIEGGLRTGGVFESRNAALLNRLQEEQAKLRMARLPSDQALRAFFDARLPDDVCAARRFDRWRRKAEADRPELLVFTQEALGVQPLDESRLDQAPAKARFGEAEAVLEYRYNPGGDDDGIHATLGLADAAAARAADADWLVPGWLTDKIEAVLSGLPRQYRRKIDRESTLPELTRVMCSSEGDFYEQLARQLTASTGMMITPEICRAVPLPKHLRMHLRVTEGEATIAEGRDASLVLEQATQLWSRKLATNRAATLYDAWPEDRASIQPPDHLQPSGTRAVLATAADAKAAQRQHWLACKLLIGRALDRDVKQLLRHQPYADQSALLYATLGEPAGEFGFRTLTSALLAEVDHSPDAAPITTEDALLARIGLVRGALADRLTSIMAVLHPALLARQQILEQLPDIRAQGTGPAIQDMRYQLGQLLSAQALLAAPWESLRRVPQYTEGIRERIQRLRHGGAAKDYERMRGVLTHWTRCVNLAANPPLRGQEQAALEAYRWAIEEYRLAQFAPRLAARGRGSTRELEALSDALKVR
ncbi:MAG: ATP-dependent RNA helicase HrpA [Planctomycetota bacterium]